MRRTLLVLAVCLFAAIGAPAAFAHATLIRSSPEPGAVLSRSPGSVLLFFDDAVRPASGTEAIRNGGKSVLGGRPHRARDSGRELVVPLEPGLPAGDYTVRWRVVSDDGHLISGVLAFAVGSGRAPPTPALSAGEVGPTAGDVFRRFLLFAGVLLAAGSLSFQLLVRRAPPRSAAFLPLVGFALALAGSGPHLSPETRFERFNDVAAIAAAAGIFAAGGAVWRARLLPGCAPAALALLAIPALRGHALDPGHSQALAVTADIAHVAAAAFWAGGLAQLTLVLPGTPRVGRGGIVRRFAAGAAVAVLLIGATGVLRALGELSGVEQLWRTGYGRAILVKSALLVGLLVLGWLNRTRLTAPRVAGELLLLAGVIAAVSILTDLRPGRQAATSGGERRTSSPLRLPPRGAVVLAHEAGDLALALAARSAGSGVELTASVLGPDARGVDGLDLTFEVGGRVVRPHRCGGGCYRSVVDGRPKLVRVRLPGSAVSFALPARFEPAGSIVAKAERVYGGLRTLVLHEQLASSPRNGISTVWRFVAPDRLSYQILGGAAGIVIGLVRWDRDAAGKPWIRSDQSPIREPVPFWASVSNAYLLRSTPGAWIVSFLDRGTPAWFTLTIDRRSYRTLGLEMTAAAHFMRHRYGPFNAPVSIRPPR